MRTLLGPALAGICGVLVSTCAHQRIYSPNEVATRPRPIDQHRIEKTSKTGIVIAEFVIERDGCVGSVRILRSPDLDLAKATETAIRRWRYAPAQKDGKPVAVRMTMTVNFTSN